MFGQPGWGKYIWKKFKFLFILVKSARKFSTFNYYIYAHIREKIEAFIREVFSKLSELPLKFAQFSEFCQESMKYLAIPVKRECPIKGILYFSSPGDRVIWQLISEKTFRFFPVLKNISTFF